MCILSKVITYSTCMKVTIGSMQDRITSVNTIQEQIFDREYFFGWVTVQANSCDPQLILRTKSYCWVSLK